MGAVSMNVVDSFSIHGDVCLTYSVYIYCDHCGSFDIQKELSRRQWTLIVGGCSLIAALAYLFFVSDLYDAGSLAWLIFLGIVVTIGILIFVFWGFPAYRCRRCGERTTIRYNTRELPSDLSIVDVPDQVVQKFFLQGWPEDQPIEAYLQQQKKNK